MSKLMSRLCVVALMLLPMATMARSIVVLGDSISAAHGMDVEQGWVALLQAKINQQRPGYTLHNESISGDTSAGGLERIDKALVLYEPAVVLLELGANDGLRGLSPVDMKTNLTAIIRKAKEAKAKVLLLGMKIPPNYGKRYVDLFYNVYPQLAKELNVPFVPFILEDVVLDRTMMQADGLHPNAKAQPIIADKIAAHLFPLL